MPQAGEGSIGKEATAASNAAAWGVGNRVKTPATIRRTGLKRAGSCALLCIVAAHHNQRFLRSHVTRAPRPQVAGHALSRKKEGCCPRSHQGRHQGPRTTGRGEAPLRLCDECRAGEEVFSDATKDVLEKAEALEWHGMTATMRAESLATTEFQIFNTTPKMSISLSLSSQTRALCTLSRWNFGMPAGS